ncbi:hypothetical protein F0365_10960 [Nonlabens sp. Ci31]|jgi:hypothetical protein|uniref:hypothetical protein n=1 Tax=Nonlabens sp. Ci31 TaxID=2608253 RepID=UPI0014642EED|nr:hypothetical protein [Nonlabens sp. Ci31]QJP34871.1 hypothetical protein F0365_10960 [Nonlabens sp. Ci31]
MKRLLIVVTALVLLASCSSVKKTETAINEGDFDQAINIAVENLVDGKNSKRNQEYIPLLERAFKKATEQDQMQLQRWQLDPNPAVLEPIYETYLRMDRRQNRIRPLLPLKSLKNNRLAQFEFQDYHSEILASRTILSDYLLDNSKEAIAVATIMESREVYNDLRYLDKINPNFRDTRALMQQALEQGTHYILVGLQNQSQTVLPERLEEELLNFSTYGINDQWTQYHNNKINALDYDYDLDIIIDRIVISPEQVLQKELIKEKQIKDGFIYEYDTNGNVKKDSLGNDIKKDKFITIKANVIQNTQLKESNVNAIVQLKDKRTLQVVDRFPVNSSFVFTYIYGSIYGDRRALEANYLETLNPQSVNFPPDEQMVYDTGEDLKLKIKQILNRLTYN